MRSRTKIEEGLQAELKGLTLSLTGNFNRLFESLERLFDSRVADKMYLDKQFDAIGDRLTSIYDALERQVGYIPGKDTAQFLKEHQG
jgi:hypothetical protein